MKLTGTWQCRSSPSRSKISCWLDANLNVQIARRAAIHARLAIAGCCGCACRCRYRRDLHFQRFLLLDLALAMAAGAGLGNDLARAPAVRAGLLHAEKALAHLHRAIAAAGAAGLGLGAGFGTAAVAGVAGVPAGDANFGRFALGRFFQGDFHGVRQVVAPVHLPPAPATSAALGHRTYRQKYRQKLRQSRQTLPPPGPPRMFGSTPAWPYWS